ncbi:MAG: IS21 family transposase [Bacteroidia bacterium]
MANQSIGSIMIREIIRMKESGLSNSHISKSLGKSRTTIVKYIRAIELSNLDNKDLLDLSDKDLFEFFESPLELEKIDRTKILEDLYAIFPHVERELKRVGVSRQLLWKEYKINQPNGPMYSQFCDHYNKWIDKSEGYMPINYKAGEKLFIDYAGKKLHIIHKETGKLKVVEVFVATLGASQYTYIECSLTQQIPDFIHSVQNSLYFFGGVPACIIPDNLKSAVTKANKYEPFINEQFACFSAHYDTSIMPTRSLKPKDKSLVEGAVNIVYRRIHAILRNKEFYSLEELNVAIKELLVEYNQTPFQKKTHSRFELFKEVEQAALKPLPTSKYELKEYKTATVQKNCHVIYSADKNYYSVPHAYIGKKVKLILSYHVVEIYHQEKRIAMHARTRVAYRYVTLKEHMPVNHTYKNDWSPEYFINWATRIGLSVKECIEKMLQRKQYPEQNYKSCLGILNFASKVGNERLNNACHRALHYDAIGYNQIKNILENCLDKQQGQENIPNSISEEHGNIRGAEYYQ